VYPPELSPRCRAARSAADRALLHASVSSLLVVFWVSTCGTDPVQQLTAHLSLLIIPTPKRTISSARLVVVGDLGPNSSFLGPTVPNCCVLQVFFWGRAVHNPCLSSSFNVMERPRLTVCLRKDSWPPARCRDDSYSKRTDGARPRTLPLKWETMPTCAKVDI
jgi:hypothetical protein